MRRRTRVTVIVAAMAAASLSGCIGAPDDPSDNRPAAAATTAPSPASDPGADACERLLNGGADSHLGQARHQVRLGVNESDWRDAEWIAWGTTVHDVATQAATSPTRPVQQQAQTLLDYTASNDLIAILELPGGGGSFNPGRLFNHALELGQQCAATQLVDPLLFVDMLGVDLDD